MEPIAPDHHLAALRADSDRIAALAQGDLDAAVPGCPGWRVADVVRHLGDVYLRQAAAIAAGHRVPPGDPAGAQGEDEDLSAYLARGRDRILAAVDRPAHTPCWTWVSSAGTVAFWQRRMAQETLVHRIDLEQAAGLASEVPADQAVDGIDEVLRVFLPRLVDYGPAAGIPGDLRASVVLSTDADAWAVEVTGTAAAAVLLDDPADPPAAPARVDGAPAELLRWLWGRGGEDALSVEGDGTHVAALRRALVAATQ